MKFRICARSFGEFAMFSAIAASTVLWSHVVTLGADDPAPRVRGEAAPGAQRDPGANRDGGGRRDADAANPGAQRAGGGQRGGFGALIPATLKLTDEQQTKIRAIEEQLQPQQVELNKKREAILTDDQKAMRADVMQKAREAGVRPAQSMAELLKMTEDQKAQMADVERQSGELRRSIQTQVMAILTDEQKAEFRKIQYAGSAGRAFSFPAEITLTDDQKAKLKAIEEEMVPKIAALAEKEAAIMTEERRAARDAAVKAFQDSGKSLRDPGVADELKAALKLTDAEKSQLEEIQKGQQDLRQEAQTRRLDLLTADQKEQLQKLSPQAAPGRGRN